MPDSEATKVTSDPQQHVEEGKVGAVLVVGAGISGIQSALDLADSGYKVYLMDKSPSIGGVMTQLDKTFPTNDCAMCILAPKLVGAGRHHNIELITNADVEGLEGAPGNYRVRINKRAKYIHEDKCTGCSECVTQCPVEIPDDFQEDLKDTKAVSLKFLQAVPLKVSIQKRGVPPCKNACPAHVNGQGYVALISMGKYKEALDLIRERCPLPSAIGRICHHPCEASCNRAEFDDPINICGLKRFAADWVRENDPDEPVFLEEKKDRKVAMVGAGPATLSAAYQLGRKGFGVTIFEREPVAGGMLRLGIPDYRLPPDILNADIDHIKKYGVEIKVNSPVGENGGPSIKDLKSEYDAVFIGTGLPASRRLNIEGEDLENVVPGLDFLKDCALGREPPVGKKVLVIGGGNVAVDVGRSALRRGAEEVHLVMLESDEIIPAHSWEVDEAKEEGIIFHTSRGPKRFVGEGGMVAGVETLNCSRVFDADGRFDPVLDPGTEEVIEGDMIIVSIGQAGDLDFLDTEIEKGRGIEIDRANFATSMEGVFAGGEITTGPGSAIEAMATGNKAAMVIEAYLNGEDVSAITETIPDFADGDIVWYEDIDDIDRFEHDERRNNSHVEPEERKRSFLEFTKGMDEQTAKAEADRCLACGICSECFECVRACLAEALDHEQTDTLIEVDVGSIILSPGFDEFDPSVKTEYGYGAVKNVVSSIEFERILSATGPFDGHVKRMSDLKQPEKVAFIQCVGSRDGSCGNEYCSQVCCMYSIKEAIIAQEHTPGLATEIFFMDIRAFGKEFDDYYKRAQEEYGIKFTRCRVSSIDQGGGDNVVVNYVENGEVKSKEFDMAVLAVGLESSETAKDLSEKLGVELNQYDFARTDTFAPLETNKEGIYVSGAFAGPKDIPDTVAQASGAAAKASSIIAEARGTLVTEKEYPPERDVSGEEPRIGVFVCHCGINIGGTVDVPAVVEYAMTLPNVVYSEHNLYTCSEDTQKGIKEKIVEHNLNRTIVASCTPRTHEPLFRGTTREGGLNPYLFEMANIRDQCSWVHMQEPEKATQKAKDLVRMAVAKSRLLEPLYNPSIDITQECLVIGGGLSGLTAALEVSGMGFPVHVVEKEAELGGNMRNIHFALGSEKNPQEILAGLIAAAEADPRVNIHKNTTVRSIEGFMGQFETTLSNDVKIEHGAIIVATGGNEYKPEEYLYGQNDKVMTQKELEKMLAEGQVPGDTYVMIQCVGSRTKERPYCSRVCCANAVKNALKIKELNPDADIYVLYKDIRTYGFREDYYQQAAELGVRFIRYEDDSPPVVADEGGLSVKIKDLVSNDELEFSPDALILSAAILPQDDNEELGKMMKVPLTKDKFFLEAHMKLRPVDFATEGIFLAGLAHAPKFMDESIGAAAGAAARVQTILSKDTMDLEPTLSHVVDKNCDGCAYCVDPCPYNAITLLEYMKEGAIKKTVEANQALCKGCGVCMATCPKQGIHVKGFKLEQLEAMVDACLEVV